MANYSGHLASTLRRMARTTLRAAEVAARHGYTDSANARRREAAGMIRAAECKEGEARAYATWRAEAAAR